jgi:hypothetical protein
VKIYNYENESKEFKNESIAQNDPLEIGKFLIPANATTIEPLSKKDGYATCFIDNEWEYIIDNRNKIYYKNKEIVVFELGDEIHDDMTLEKYTTEEKKSNELTAKSKAIENHIYKNYPRDTQAQDNGWVTNFTTKLNASVVVDLDKQIVNFSTLFLKGKKLDKILVHIDDEIKPMYEKLVKVAVKNEWSFLVIQEGKKAISENREPVYPEFPKFD